MVLVDVFVVFTGNFSSFRSLVFSLSLLDSFRLDESIGVFVWQIMQSSQSGIGERSNLLPGYLMKIAMLKGDDPLRG